MDARGPRAACGHAETHGPSHHDYAAGRRLDRSECGVEEIPSRRAPVGKGVACDQADGTARYRPAARRGAGARVRRNRAPGNPRRRRPLVGDLHRPGRRPPDGARRQRGDGARALLLRGHGQGDARLPARGPEKRVHAPTPGVHGEHADQAGGSRSRPRADAQARLFAQRERIPRRGRRDRRTNPQPRRPRGRGRRHFGAGLPARRRRHQAYRPGRGRYGKRNFQKRRLRHPRRNV